MEFMFSCPLHLPQGLHPVIEKKKLWLGRFKDFMTYWLRREGLHAFLIECEDVHIVVLGGSIQKKLGGSEGYRQVAITACGRDSLGH